MELNHTYEYPEELALIDTISDVRISGIARFRYLVASDVKFSLRNISEILAVKENFVKDVKEWQEIELYQARNLFDMCVFVYDKLYNMSYSWRDMITSCTDGLTVKDIERLLELCLNPSFYKKLIKMKIKRLPFHTVSTKHTPRLPQLLQFKFIYSVIRRELRGLKTLFRKWRRIPGIWRKAKGKSNHLKDVLV